MGNQSAAPWVICSDHVVLPRRPPTRGWIEIDGARVRAVGQGEPPDRRGVLDIGHRYLSPGFVDLHVHGGGGAQVNGDDPVRVAQDVRTLAAFHARHGTTSLLATTVADTSARLDASLRGIAAARSGPDPGARVIGAHLEGPWLSLERAGAQQRDVLRAPSLAEFDELMDAAPETVRMITIAPELAGAMDVIRAGVR